MMNRYLPVTCLAVTCAWLFFALLPQPSMADFVLDSNTDYFLDIDSVFYSDQAGRTVNCDFSALLTGDDGNPISTTEQIIYFGNDSVTYAPDHEGVYYYNIQADEETTPAACIQRMANDQAVEYSARIGINHKLGTFAWFPLVMGDTPARNIYLKVTFKNFQHVTKAQTGYHFELVAGGCRVTALWFTGTRPDGKVYEDALIFNGSILGSNGITYPVTGDDGYPVEDIITSISDPSKATVILWLIISSGANSSGEPVQGGYFSAKYQIDNDEPVVLFTGSTLNVRQVTGYDGTYTDDYNVEHHYDAGDPVGEFSFPFVNLYTAPYSAGGGSSSEALIDEHVSGSCFISGSAKE
ncbi:MAG: hypothetical protein JEZ02_00465 [Desulfatibacillum sp.]|nr:hypothetical protein [Desulfatibacillum sp.]